MLSVLPFPCCLQEVCKACQLLEGLNRGLPRLGIGRTKGRLQGEAMPAAAGAPASSPDLPAGADEDSQGGPGGDGSSNSGGGSGGEGSGGQQSGGAQQEAQPAGFSYLQNKAAIAAHPSSRALAQAVPS